MKIRSKILAVSLFAVVLVACTSTQEQSSYSNPIQVAPPSNMALDVAYIARVEQLALRRGVKVQWVNLPTVHTKADQ